MRRYTEYLRWRVRLALVDRGQRVRDRELALLMGQEFIDGPFARFVDKVSPFDRTVGYRRVGLRRLLYNIRYPVARVKILWTRLVKDLIYTMVEQPSLGRYEGSFYDPATTLKVEWLDNHSEYSNETTGDTDSYMWAALFETINVPWSLVPETWLLTVDYHGFVSGLTGFDAPRRFNEIRETYEKFEPELNLEGDPAFNGAFGESRPTKVLDFRTIDPRDGGRLDR